MITARPQKNLKAAKNYFREHLAKGDYHSQDQTVQGHWFGKGIERLGLDPASPVTELEYTRLCENLHPITGSRLTVRQRKVDRRVFYDFVASAPKSVSILALLGRDDRILAVHDAACRAAMTRMERVAATRLRKGGRRAERTTGEIAAAVFRHDTSRALDPQLHTHFVVFNATWDEIEKRWKALEPSEMFEEITFFTEVYRSDLAVGLHKLGYQILNTEHGFEIEGVSPTLIDRFSKRRRQILEAEARITAEIGKLISNNARAAVAHSSRAAKRRDLTGEEVLAHQHGQLEPAELEALQSLTKAARSVAPTARNQPGAAVANHPLMSEGEETSSFPNAERDGMVASASLIGEQLRKPRHVRSHGFDDAEPNAAPNDALSEMPPIFQTEEDGAKAAIDYARDHLFERQSTVKVHRLLREALRFVREKIPLSKLEAELGRRTEFIKVGKTLTTRETLEQEQRMVAMVNEGASRCRPLNAAFTGESGLTAEQRLALQMVLRSPDEVIALRGRAGTGKTRVLTGIVRGIEERHAVVVLAPTAAAVEVLRAVGLNQAATVQRFLADPEFQREAEGKALLVDEASFLSVRNMLALIEATRALRCRLILSGDTRQHSGVEAGDALRLLEQYATLPTIQLTRVQRQVDREYRTAITELSKGEGSLALRRLEKLGAVHEVEDEGRYQVLAANYVSSIKAKKTALIVSPTWREIELVTGEVRAKLKQEKLLGRAETSVIIHQALKWTRAQKQDLRNYKSGMVITFHKPTTEFGSGEWAEVVGVAEDKLRVRKPGQPEPIHITRKQAGCFDVAKEEELAVAAGERLLVLGNRKKDGLFNGQLVTVKEVRPDGGILLTDHRIMKPEFRAFTHGYCVTSHAAQGRTVDHVYVAVDSQTRQAAHLNQFYVSTSRGREQVKIFTDCIDYLRAVVNRPGDRLSATEMLERAGPSVRAVPEQRQAARSGITH